MKKLLITALLAMCIVAGCGKTEDSKGSGGTSSSSIQSSTENSTESTEAPENTEEPTESNILMEKEYKVDGKEVSISLNEKDGKLSIDITGYAKNEEKASILLATYVSELKKLNLEKFNISIFCDKLSVVYMSTDDGYYIAGTNKDGSYVLSAPDWIVTEFTMPEKKVNSYVKKAISVLNSFAEDMENETLN